MASGICARRRGADADRTGPVSSTAPTPTKCWTAAPRSPVSGIVSRCASRPWKRRSRTARAAVARPAAGRERRRVPHAAAGAARPVDLPGRRARHRPRGVARAGFLRQPPRPELLNEDGRHAAGRLAGGAARRDVPTCGAGSCSCSAICFARSTSTTRGRRVERPADAASVCPHRAGARPAVRDVAGSV